MSLEKIVVECGTAVFEPKDIERAQETLKMAQFLDRSLKRGGPYV